MLRRKCFEKDIRLVVVKNTLLKKALEKLDGEYGELYGVLKDSTSVMFSETGNAPAKLIKEFRKKLDKPVLKAAFVEESIYIGDDQIEILSSLKSKEELIGDIILLLQSPAKNVLSALQSGGNTLAGIIKTLSEKE
jgi:large subunit ribosomal protein L10